MYEFTIPGISGGADQKAIVGAILALDGNATLDFNWGTQQVSVKSSADLADISARLAALGYQIDTSAQRDPDAAHHCHCDQCD